MERRTPQSAAAHWMSREWNLRLIPVVFCEPCIYKINMRAITRLFGYIGMSVFFGCSAVPAAQTNSITFTNLQGTVFENVRIVKVDGSGLVYRYNDSAGGGIIKLSELSGAFLRSLGYDPERLLSQELDRAVAAGQFREVDGVVYDLRKKQSAWYSFQNVKLIQHLGDGDDLVDPSPVTPYVQVIHVKGLAAVSDTELFSFRAKLTGTYSYINKNDDTRVIRSYDTGRACSREEIPDQILRGLADSARISSPASSMLSQVSSSDEPDVLSASGTGFFITKDGFLVTNNHVVEGAKKIRVRTPSETFDARVVKASRTFDLAIIKVEGTFAPLPLDFNRLLNLGDSVFTIGYPNFEVQGASPKYTDGKISSLSGAEDDPSQYQISVPIQPGNSGGPLVADNGSVVGIVRAKLNDIAALVNSGSIPQNVNYAVKVKYLRDLIETVPGLTGKLTADRLPAGKSAVQAAQEATAMVLIY